MYSKLNVAFYERKELDLGNTGAEKPLGADNKHKQMASFWTRNKSTIGVTAFAIMQTSPRILVV